MRNEILLADLVDDDHPRESCDCETPTSFGSLIALLAWRRESLHLFALKPSV